MDYPIHHVVTLSYRTKAPPQYGAFKRAYPSSRISSPIFASGQLDICLKQAFYKRDDTSSIHVYQGATQGRKLTVELNCLGWAGALLRLVYQFIESSKVTAPPNLPQLRFVEAGLAVAQSDSRDTFLVEELIRTVPFVKYINNSSAVPCSFADDTRSLTARFLAFCQHVQWEQTKGLVYISDFQGKCIVYQ